MFSFGLPTKSKTISITLMSDKCSINLLADVLSVILVEAHLF